MHNLVPMLRYIWLTLKHKRYVWVAGAWTGAPLWNLLIHDLSKFTPAEAPHYGRQFFGDKSDPLGFARAWNHHQKANPHHWEYWIPHSGHDRSGYLGGTPLPMPERYVREMVADWFGASRAYEGRYPTSLQEWPWLQQNFWKIDLHPETRTLALRVLQEAFDEMLMEGIGRDIT